MRSRGGDRLLQVRVDPAQTLDRAVQHEQRGDERQEIAGRERARADLCRCRTTAAPAMAMPPRNSMIGGSGETALVTFMLVRYRRWDAVENRSASCCSALNALTMRWPVKASAVRCERCSSCFLAASRRPSHALSEPYQRIDDQRRTGEATSASRAVEVEQQGRYPMSDKPSRSRSPTVSETACCTWLTSFVTRDISCPAGPAAEEGRPTDRGCGGRAGCEDRGRPAGRCRSSGRSKSTIPMPFDQIGRDDRAGPEREPHPVRVGKNIVDDRLNEIGDVSRGCPIRQHRDEGRHEPAPVGPRVAKEA